MKKDRQITQPAPYISIQSVGPAAVHKLMAKSLRTYLSARYQYGLVDSCRQETQCINALHQRNASLQGLLRPADSTSLTRIRLRARVAPEIAHGATARDVPESALCSTENVQRLCTPAAFESGPHSLKFRA